MSAPKFFKALWELEVNIVSSNCVMGPFISIMFMPLQVFLVYTQSIY